MCVFLHILLTQIRFNSICRWWKKKRFCLQIAIFPNKFFFHVVVGFFFLKKLVPFLDMIVICMNCNNLCLKDFLADFYRVPHLEKREMKFEIEHRAHSYTRSPNCVRDFVNVSARECVCIAVHFLSVWVWELHRYG